MRYTVNDLAKLANISVRTLHYYHAIELLCPSDIGDNGYRYYDEGVVFRLQQIMFYRELGVGLKEIKVILDSDDFDVVRALEQHKRQLEQKRQHLHTLIKTINSTRASMKGDTSMTAKNMFQGFDEATQNAYEQEAAERWGEEKVKESQRNWKRYSKDKRQEIIAESHEIYAELARHIGDQVGGQAVQELIARWHQNLRYFYEPSDETLLGLAKLYTDDPKFRAFYDAFDERLAEFLRLAIEHYVQGLSQSS